MSTKMQRAVYAEMFGPTTGDRVRLADTDIIIEVEKDFCTYGEEVKFGGGKVIRDGMGQSQVTNKQGAVDTVITNALILDHGAVDTVITNALILDHWGVVKADVGLKGDRIAAIGKAGNPDIQSPSPRFRSTWYPGRIGHCRPGRASFAIIWRGLRRLICLWFRRLPLSNCSRFLFSAIDGGSCCGLR